MSERTEGLEILCKHCSVPIVYMKYSDHGVGPIVVERWEHKNSGNATRCLLDATPPQPKETPE
jgi:hypothetical protein